jgi:hypothetical protein
MDTHEDAISRKKISELLGVPLWIQSMFSKFRANGLRMCDPSALLEDTETVLMFENIKFFIQQQQEGKHHSLYIYLQSLDTYSLHIRISAPSASVVGLYPNKERIGWNMQGVKSVGRFLLRFVDWICVAFGIHTISLLDCSVLNCLQKIVRLPMLMKLATNKTYYEGSGYSLDEEAGMDSAIRYYATEQDARRLLGECFDAKTTRDLLEWASIDCEDLLVCDYASIVLDKVFRNDRQISWNILDIMSVLKKKFGYVVKPASSYTKHLPCSTKQSVRRTRRVRPYSQK